MKPLQPTASTLAKLGSIVVHAEEMLEPMGHGFDRIALESALRDSDVQTWLSEMRTLTLLPVKRSREPKTLPLESDSGPE